jgi:hypothetical protein
MASHPPDTDRKPKAPVDLQILERATVIAYLRSGTNVGGNDEVAREIARALERGDHERYVDLVRSKAG